MQYEMRNFPSKTINMQSKIRPYRVDFFLEINKRACTSIRYTRVPITYFSDQEKILKFEAEGQEFAKCLRLLEQIIKQ